MTTILRYNKCTNTLTPVNKRDYPKKLTPEQRREHKNAWNRKRNAQKRREYTITTAPPCSRCGKALVMCECPPLDRHVPQYRDVVRTLDMRTWKTRIEIK